MNDGKNMAGMVSEKVALGEVRVLDPTKPAQAQMDALLKAVVDAASEKDRVLAMARVNRAHDEWAEMLGQQRHVSTHGVTGPAVKIQSCSDGFCDLRAEIAKMTAAIGERLRAADAVQVPHGAPMVGLDALTTGYGTAQQVRAPGKMFSRSDILAIIRAEIARKATTTALYNLLNIFENLE